MTSEQKIDANIDSILKAAGSSLKYHTLQKTLDDLRNAMRKIMSDSYISGSSDNYRAMQKRDANN